MGIRHGLLFLLVLVTGGLTPLALGQTFHVPPGKIAGEIRLHQEIKARKGALSSQDSANYARSGLKLQRVDAEECALYVAQPLSAKEISTLESQGIEVHPTYVPPVAGRHAYGFYLSTVEYASLALIQADPRFLRLDSVEYAARPLNDLAAGQTHVTEVQNGTGVTARNGAGIKIAVADSGFDLTHADLPTPIEAYDLTDGNSVGTWGTNVANLVSPHGTHVLGSVGGSGSLSGGKYKGSAPGASYYLYKIGNDINASASNSDIIEAINRAVAQGCDLFSMSYGGPNTSLDGSDTTCQAIDAATAAGMTCFISAGNEADGGDSISHTLATVNPASSVNAIGFTISNSGGVSAYTTAQTISLIWRDNLTADLNATLSCTNIAGGESLSGGFGSISTRGTETRSYTLTPNIGAGASKTYLFTVTNSAASGAAAPVHLFRTTGIGEFASFVNAGTVMSPAVADTAMAVGAWTQRKTWTNYQGSGFQFSNFTVNTIAPFSSRGPRIDGVIKPEVAAPGAATISARDSVAGLANTAALIIDNDGLNQNGSGPANYYVMNGTSMACPYAAGIAALVLEADPTLTPAELRATLQQTAAHPGAPDGDSGYGLLNALDAVELIESTPTAPEADLFNGVAALASGGGPVDFGTVRRGATSPTLTLTLRNTGDATLATSGTLSLPVGFSLTQGLATTIAAGSSDDFTVQFDTSTSGTFSGMASFSNNDADENPYTFSLLGEVTEPEIVVAPATASFGNWDVDAGTTGPRTITITNAGTADLALAGISIVGADAGSFGFAAAPSLAPVPPAGTRDLFVQFDPGTTGAKSAQVRIVSDDADEATIEIGIGGTGLDQEIDVSVPSLSFGARAVDDGPSVAQSVIISNLGNSDLHLGSVVLNGSGSFVIDADTGEATLAPAATRTVQIEFDPTIPGALSGQLTINSDDTSEAVVNVGFSGTGLQQALALSEAELLFPPVDVVLGDEPTTRGLTLENEGDAPLQITSLTIGGPHAMDFGYVTTPTLPIMLGPSTTHMLVLRFAPVETERSLDLSAMLTIGSNDPNTPAVITLRGDAVPVELSSFSID